MKPNFSVHDATKIMRKIKIFRFEFLVISQFKMQLKHNLLFKILFSKFKF